ncbi:MAG: response regulator transcription factor [Acidobacteriota bacterium]|nr:response regulator transcription factor [Acidobacteriota bacterium]
MSDQISVYIADDHPIVRQGFIRIIEDDPRFRIIGQSGKGDDALNQIRALNPRIAVLDVNMPGKTGLEIAKALREEDHPTIIVILTMYKDQEFFDEAMNLGIMGYLLKESAVNDLLNCLNSVHAGNHYISPTISGYLIRPRKKKEENKDENPIHSLTDSEKRVLRLIGRNMTSKEIAEELYISYRTVQNHRFNICQKLGFKGHNKLLQFALEHKSELG